MGDKKRRHYKDAHIISHETRYYKGAIIDS